MSVLGILYFLGGCQREPGSHVPLNDEDPNGTTSTTSAPPTIPPFDRFAQIVQMPIVSHVKSSHPVGDYVGRIRVDEGASQYGKKARPPMPSGAVIVEELASDRESGAIFYYVMAKRDAGFFPEGNDWEFMVLGPGGDVQARGKIALCARCHGEAPRESLFEQIGN